MECSVRAALASDANSATWGGMCLCVCVSVCLGGPVFYVSTCVFKLSCVVNLCQMSTVRGQVSSGVSGMSGVSDVVFDGSASGLGLLGLSSRPNPMPLGPPCALPSAWNALPCLVPHGLLPIPHSLLRSCPHGKRPQPPGFPCVTGILSRPRNTDSLSTEAASPPAWLLSPVFSPWRGEDQSLLSGPGSTYFLFFPLSLKDKNQGELIPPVLRFTVTYLREKGE